MPLNRNLEAMARQLYDYWFVQFDFPDENGRPYKSSGGNMVWNEKLKRAIPEKWGAALMKDFLVIGNGRDHKDLKTGIYPVYGSGGLMRYVNDFLFSGESVLLPRKGSLSNFMYVNESFWTVDTMFYTKEKLKGAAKFIFYSLRYVDITRYDSGTGVPSMTSISYYAMPFIKPTNDIIKLFDENISPWLVQIKRNEAEIKVLTIQRDELLPLLMNGQVSVMPTAVNCDLVFISLMKSIVYNHCLGFLLHMSSCIRNCLNLLRKKNIIKNLSGILRFFLAASAKFRQSKPKGFSFLNSRNHLKNNSQTSSKINLNSF
ncbi:restriction endonuclease subunit S [Sangeribacter muris]|uniref:restriction endonuclease subunit S n=1 Tax=Sangeribacter muris TaxID=2880703 RepID=UPI00244DDF3A|nr:restriction endonuclease subunit S [Sangeribacter muris]